MTDKLTHKVAAIFNSVADGYDNEALRIFPLSADILVQLAELEPEFRVLDMAAGTGAVALTAAQHLLQGRVQAIDVASRMLNRLRNKAQQFGVENLDALEMDAQTMDFRDRVFDRILCNLGLFFMPDMDAALDQCFRAMKPGGKLLFSSFIEPPFQPMTGLLVEKLQQFGVDMESDGLSWPRLSEPDSVKALLEQSGFRNMRSLEKTVSYDIKDEQDWATLMWYSGYREYIDRISPDLREHCLGEHLLEVSRVKTGDGLPMNAKLIYYIADRPEE